jgi:translation initiation factor 3 subunit G
MELPPMDDESANKGAANQAAAAAPAAGADSGKYVPPSMRGGVRAGPGSSMRDRERDDTCSIRITNLAEDTVEDDLRSLCKSCGPITRIYLAKDKETGLAKGFAFVNFIRREDAAKAIEVLNGHGFGHLILHVEWAKNPST